MKRLLELHPMDGLLTMTFAVIDGKLLLCAGPHTVAFMPDDVVHVGVVAPSATIAVVVSEKGKSK